MKEEALKLIDEWDNPDTHEWRDTEQDWGDRAYSMIRKLLNENEELKKAINTFYELSKLQASEK